MVSLPYQPPNHHMITSWPNPILGGLSSLFSHVQLCDPMDSTVHGILQARILEWTAFLFSMGSSQPRDGTQVSSIAGGFFTSWAIREAQEYWSR